MEKQENLRFEFVEMLFALAIGQVAIELGDLIFKKIDFLSHPQIFSHLFLATLIITLSWVGWQKSQSHGNILLINSIYSVQFLILLTDLFLVICYFIIVRGADYNTAADGTINPAIDVKTELLWTVVIFGTYCVWDVLTKLIDFDIQQTNSIYNRVRKTNWNAYFERAWQTWICLIISIYFWYHYSNSAITNWQAFIIDIMLASLYFWFRGLKALKLDLSKAPKLEKYELTKGVVTKLSLPDASYPIQVVDNSYWLKIFFAVILPILLLVFGFFIYKSV